MASNQNSKRGREREGERDQATATNPWSRGGLLPFHHGGGVGDVGEVGEATGDGSGSVSPSNLRRFSLCFVVSFFSATSLRERLGRSLYRGF
jgi:hypothetical protein